MNKFKQAALVISAISVMGVASVSLASSCPTSISPATSACLSTTADATFQQNYLSDYAKQSGGSSFSSSYNGNTGNTDSSYYSKPSVSSQQQAPVNTDSNTNNNNDNSSSKKGIRWF